MNRNIFAMRAALAVLGASLMGCGKNDDSPGAAASAEKRTPSTAPAAAPALQSILTTWQQGDTEAAVRQFVETDWSARPLFSADSVWSLSEDQFKRLPAADREAKSRELLAQTGTVKQLAAAVAQAGSDAAARNETAQARQYLTALRECGRALDRPDSLALLKLVGQGMQKKADAELSKLPP